MTSHKCLLLKIDKDHPNDDKQMNSANLDRILNVVNYGIRITLLTWMFRFNSQVTTYKIFQCREENSCK